MQGVRLMASWVLALFLGAMFLWIADQTLFPAASRNVIFPLLADYSGIPLFEPTGRLATGLVEVLAALLLILPWTRRIGAILGLAVALGAVAAHILWLDIKVPVTYPPGAADDGGQLFYLALALLAMSLLLAFVHPGANKESANYYDKH